VPALREGRADKDYNLHPKQDAGSTGVWRFFHSNSKQEATLKHEERIEGTGPYDKTKQVFNQTLKRR
jgi:hypothetical protein